MTKHLLFFTSFLCLSLTAYSQANLSGIVINEILPDPTGTTSFDTNCDGSFDADDDFVEFYNGSGTTIDISGWQVYEGAGLQFTFPGAPGSMTTVIAAGDRVAVVDDFTSPPANYFDANGLPINNSGDQIILFNPTADEYISAVFNGFTLDNADVLATSATATSAGDEDWGNDTDGESLQRQTDGSTTIVSGVPTPPAKPTNTSVAFEDGQYSLDENGGTVDACVAITNPDATNATNVTVSILGTSTASGSDYSNTSLLLVFPAGSTASQCITFTGIDDGITEGGESIELQITSVSGGNAAVIGGLDTATVVIIDDDVDLVINEILADPAADDAMTTEVEGDANGDGIRDGSEDEFVEIINTGSTDIDISDYTISDAVATRHTFKSGTILCAGGSIVVFGGGDISTFTGLTGLVDTATVGFLGLNNGGDDVVLRDDMGNIVTSFTYGSEGGNNQSLARDPDGTGNFVEHSTILGNAVAFSPTSRNTDGTNFVVCTSTCAADLDDTDLGGGDPSNIPAGTYQASNSIESTGTVATGTTVVFDAGNIIILTAGFTAENGSTFTAMIGGCAPAAPVQNIEDRSLAVVTEQQVKIYPNPMRRNGTIALELSTTQRVSIQLFDLSGKQIQVLVNEQEFLEGTHNIPFHIHRLTTGTYFARVQIGQEVQMQKVIVMQ
ncbi:MAG: lamin tail domain-containing protein [Bacteroidota bacterium]